MFPFIMLFKREKEHSLKYATKLATKDSFLPHGWPNLIQGTKPRLKTCLENALHSWTY